MKLFGGFNKDMTKLDFWEKVLGSLVYRALTFDISETSRKELKKDSVFLNKILELNRVARTISSDISRYISSKIGKKIELDTLSMKDLEKKTIRYLKGVARKKKINVSELAKKISKEKAMFNMARILHTKDADSLFKKYEKDIIEHSVMKTDLFKKRLKLYLQKLDEDVNEKLLEAVTIKSKTVEDSLKGMFANSKQPEKQRELVEYYLQYMATSDIFKIIQTDNILLYTPLKGLLTEMKQFVEKSDLLKLRIREPILESVATNPTKDKIVLSKIDDYIFLNVHKFLRAYMAPVDYKKKVNRVDSHLFRTSLSFGLSVYDSILKDLIKYVKRV